MPVSLYGIPARRLALLWLVLLVVLFGVVLLAPGLVSGEGQPPDPWDHRLTELGIFVEPAADCSQGCWRLVSAQALDPDQGGGLHHVFIKLLDEHDVQLAGRPWHVAWPGGDTRLLTKPAPDWADEPLWACYYPDQGPGPYTVYAGDDPSRSDQVHGAGLPVCHHWSYQFIYRWAPPGGRCETCEPRLWLPLILEGNSP